jgi:ABC-type glutathione transport system ATPase component
LEKKGQYITVIIVTHDLDLVYNFAYQAIFLRKNYNNKGEIAEMGSPKQLFHQKGTLLEKQYMAFKQNVSEETAAN